MPNNDTNAINAADLRHLEKRVSDLSWQVSRVKRVTDVDTIEDALNAQRDMADLMGAIQSNTAHLSQIVKLMEAERTDVGSPDMFYWKMKEVRATQARYSLEHIRLLASCSQELTPVCPCGQHKGIRFIRENGVIVEELCPRQWWVKQSRLAYEEKHLEQFVKTTPLGVYLKQFLISK